MNNTTFTLITGASGGIGFELANEAAAAKQNLILVARSADRLQKISNDLKAKHGIEVKTYSIDIAKPIEVQNLIDKIKTDNLTVQTLINNAGFGDFGDFADAELSKNLEMIDLNISSLTHLTHYFLQNMKKAGFGRIMNVASTAAFMPGPGMAVYYASKAYVLSFSEALSRELKGSGVSVTALCPGPTDTGFAITAGLGKSLLHRILPAATSASVAKAGYRALLKGKTIEIPGLMNKLSTLTPRFTPRSIVRNMIYGIHKNH